MATQLGTIDMGGDGKTVLLASLNHKLGTSFTTADFEFTDPSPVTTPTPTHNTVIQLGALAHSGYYGTKTVYYNRVHVSELGIITVAKGTATRVSHLLTKINDKYGILITSADIYDAVLPAIPAGATDVEVQLDFRPTSVVFYGGTKIVMGNNDPAGSGSGSGTVLLPFSGKYLFFSEHTTQHDIIDPYSILFDQDKTRRNIARTIPPADGVNNINLRSFPRPSRFSSEYGYILGAWSNTATGVVRAVNGTGHILERNADGTSWTRVSDIGGVNMMVSSDVRRAQENPLAPVVVTNNLGTVYIVSPLDNDVRLFTSTDNGNTWTHVVLTGDTLGHSPSQWTRDYMTHFDSLVVGDKVFLVYLFQNGGASTMEVGEIDINTGVAKVHSFADMTVTNTDEVLNIRYYTDTDFVPQRACFFTEEAMTSSYPRVAVLSGVGTSITMEVMTCEYNTTSNKYEVKATMPLDIYLAQDRYLGSFISSYTMSLSKDTSKQLDVIELGTMLPSANMDVEMFNNWALRTKTETGFYQHGLIVLTSVRQGNQRTPWHKSEVMLSPDSFPKGVIMKEQHRRSHYYLQPENGVYRLSFEEDDAVTNFVAMPNTDETILLEPTGVFNNAGRFGIAPYTPPVVMETSNNVYPLAAYSNAEASAPDIAYSFITKTPDGNSHWLNSPSTASPLVERFFPAEYSFMGRTPVALFNNDAEVFAITSENKGVFSYDKATKRWKHYSTANVFASSNDQSRQIGWAKINAKPEDFKVFWHDTSQGRNKFKMKLSRSIHVFNSELGATVPNFAINDECIMQLALDADFNFNTERYYEQDQAESYGVNILSWGSPRRFTGFSLNSNGIAKYRLEYTDPSDTSPLEQVYNTFDALAGVATDTVVLDIRTEMNYLDINWLALVKTAAGVTQLVQQDFDSNVTTFDLFGGTNPATATFAPEVAFHLYEFVDANYVPLVYYGNKKLLWISRLREDGSFTKTMHTLTIPNDNGTALKPIPVFSSNRQEYLLAQKGNGIFKINYVYNPATKTAAFNLVRLFSTNVGFDQHEVISACIPSYLNVDHPWDSLIPTNPPNGTLLNTFCTGTTQMGRYADGNGGTYNDTIEVNSTACGYVAPPPATFAADAVTLTASLTHTDATPITSSTVQANEEGDSAYVTYTLADALVDDVTFDVSLVFNSAAAAGIDEMTITVGAGAATPITYPGTVTIPAGETAFVLSFKFVEDHATEGDETFTVVVATQPGETHITNDAPIETEITVLDTSLDGPPAMTPYIDDFANNNKAFDTVTPGTNLFEFFDNARLLPAGTYTPSVNFSPDGLEVTRVINVSDPDDSVIGAKNFLTHGAPFIRFTVEIDVKEVLTTNDAGPPHEVVVDATQPLPANHRYMPSEFYITLVNEEQSNTDGGRSLKIAIVYNQTNNDWAASSQVQRFDTQNTFYQNYAPGSGIAIDTADMAQGGLMALELTATDNGTSRNIVITFNGNEIVNFDLSEDIIPMNKKIFPLLTLNQTSWTKFVFKKFEIEAA